MRVIDATPERHSAGLPSRRSLRAANVEMLGLVACSVVVVLGVWLTTWGRVSRLDGAQGTVNLRALESPAQLAALLVMFDSPAERAAVAAPLYRRAVGDAPVLDHVGGLSDVTLTAAQVQSDPRLTELRGRLARRPAATQLALLTPADIAALKPAVVVRSRAEFDRAVRLAMLWFLGAFWVAHLVRRWRRADDDPVVLPVLLTLAGAGLMCMLALRDPLRDTLTVTMFVTGVVGGLVLLVGASEIDFESSPLRRAVLAPLALALAFAALLLVFGTGPGSSGVKVNLFGFQPVEAIRLLVVFAVAAYFARRLEFLRELSEPPTAAQPWLRVIRPPRWKDVRPVVVSMALVLAFFFLQKDLGPALVLSAVVMALYAIARGRAAFVAVGFGMLLAGFAGAYLIGFPATVGQRVTIWLDPWNNGVPGGNQIAHGLWAMSTGAFWGSGPGLGSPQSIPAGHTDFVLAALGEELGFVGVVVVIALYAILSWRCLRIAARAPGDYSAFLATGVALALIVQAFVIASGLLGLFPLAGVVTPFLSYGRSSMLANCAAVGVVLAIARRRGAVRAHLRQPLRALSAVLVACTVAVASRAAWVQVVRADAFATSSSLSEQADGGYRFEYNPRLIAAARGLERGSIYDRNGLVLATSRPAEMQSVPGAYQKAGLAREGSCRDGDERCYPLAGITFGLLGDWTRQTNWAARNSSYLERDADARLKGFDDHQRVVEVVNPRTGARERTIKRDYRELLPIVRHGIGSGRSGVATVVNRPRDLRSSIDARLQVRAARALRAGIERGTHTRGAAIVIDVESGDVLASVSYPWPEEGHPGGPSRAPRGEGADNDPLLDRARYGLYPPGSTFKLLLAGAALRARPPVDAATFACMRLPDGRVGNFVRGWTRPVRDDPMDTSPHGQVDLRRGLVVSCNAYFAQLAMRLGPQPILDAAGLFQIDAARPATAAELRRTLPHAGYGQADVLVSPLKMARVAASIAGRGLVLPLQWTAGAAPPADEPQQRFLSEEDAATLSRYMREAVTSGTGRTLSTNATPIAGKTGTAEVDNGRAHSWFTGFAPFGGSRRIAFAVVVENAGYGARAAAPVAGEIVDAARELGLVK